MDMRRLNIHVFGEKFLSLLLVCSASLNILLAMRLHSERLTRTTRDAPMRSREGQTLPPMIARKPSGQPILLDYAATGLPRIYYTFRPGCSWCIANKANVESLATAAKDKFEFVGICLHYPNQPKHDCQDSPSFPTVVYLDASDVSRADYKLGMTPQTLVISSQGVLLKEWRGAYQGDQARDIEKFFRISLPGLKRSPGQPNG